AVEKNKKPLSSEEEAAERKILQEAAENVIRPLEEAIAQARKATKAYGDMVRQAADERKWIDHAQRELTPGTLFASLAEIAETSIQLQKSLDDSALSTAVTKIGIDVPKLATLDLKEASGILEIHRRFVSFARLCESFNPLKTPTLTRRSKGRPNYVEYAEE